MGNWIDHFADNYNWSNATLVTKGMAPYGAIALNDIDRIGDRLNTRKADPEAWWQEWTAMARHCEGLADAAAQKKRDFTAGDYYLRAGYYYYTGERMVYPGPAKTAIYEDSLRCFHAGLKRRYPQIEFLEVPYEGTTLPAYFLKAQNTTGRAPTVVVFDGLDNCKEMSILFCGLEFSRRGFNALCIDGPGQGETLRLRNIHSRYDYDVPGRAAYDYVASRPDVDPQKVVVMGYSFGGYAAPRIVAFDHRYAGGVAFGAMWWDMHGWVSRMAEQMRLGKAATSHFQIPWVFGVGDLKLEPAIEMMKKFSLAGVAEKIQCPFLVVHGANDRIVPPAEAQKLYDAIGAKEKTIKIFDAEEGAAEHCQVDDRQAGVNYIADWITETVVRAR